MALEQYIEQSTTQVDSTSSKTKNTQIHPFAPGSENRQGRTNTYTGICRECKYVGGKEGRGEGGRGKGEGRKGKREGGKGGRGKAAMIQKLLKTRSLWFWERVVSIFV